MSKNIFRTKSINQFLSETKQDGGMNRVLGTFGLTMLGIGCIVGTGIFVLTGIAAANYLHHRRTGLRLCCTLLF